MRKIVSPILKSHTITRNGESLGTKATIQFTAIKFVVPKSFNACAFPMYKLGNAWEMNTCVQACMPLEYKCFQAFPRGVQAWTQAFISQAFPSLYMGNAQALKLLGTTNFIAVVVHAICLGML